MILIAALLSLVIGLSLGLLGGGGSILTVPILRYGLGVEAHSAIATSLLVVASTSFAGMIHHLVKGRVQFRTGLIFGAAGMVGAFLSGRVAHLIPAGVLLVLFAGMMMATAFAMLQRRARRATHESAGKLPVPKVIAEGLVVGAVTGLVGAGGGFLVVPALVLLGGLPMEVAVGTSLLVISMKSTAGFVGFLGHTPIDWNLALLVSGVAVIGGVLGSALASHVPPDRLRTSFGWFVVAMALFMLGQEIPRLLDARVSVVAAAAIAALGTAAAFGLKRLLGGHVRVANETKIELSGGKS